MNRTITAICTLLLAGLFGVAFWFRITSLEAMPPVDGDEAWHAIQAFRCITGQPFLAWTPYANPVNPFFSGLHVPILLSHEPALWTLRIPAIACGVLVVVLSYVLGRRILDQSTALIASATLAVLPVSVLFSRISFDASQSPLFTLLAVYYAFRANWRGLLMALVACYIVHPTNIFILPAALIIFLAQELRKYPGDVRKQWRIAAITLAVPAALVLVVGLVVLQRPELKGMHQPGLKPTLGGHDPLRSLTAWRRLFLVLPVDAPPRVQRWNDLVFWVPLFGVTALGTWRLVREQRWERVALVVGTGASALGFFVVAGSNALCPTWVAWLRYGLFLLVPAVFSFACLVRSLLIEPTTHWRTVGRQLQHAGLLAIGIAMLCCLKLNFFDLYTAGGGESVWTLQTETPNPYERAFTTIQRDFDWNGDNRIPKTIIAENHWAQQPLEYLTLARDPVEIVPYDKWNGFDPEVHRELLKTHLLWGAVVVANAGEPLDRDVKSFFPADRLQTQIIPGAGAKDLIVHRLRRETSANASPALGAAGKAPKRR